MVVLENDAVRLACEPEVGARITSLVDRRTGREWLVPGTLPGTAAAWAAEGAVFGGAEAFGWDECLPTVAPCPDPADAMAPALRDHGEQWGRPADVEATDDRLVATWTRSRWPLRFRRAITLEGAAVACEYELEAGGDRALPILWSMHALLSLEPGSAIVVEPGGPARLTHHVGFGIPPGLESLAWPDGGAALDRRARHRGPAGSQAVPRRGPTVAGRRPHNRRLRAQVRLGSRVRADARDLARLRRMAARGSSATR